MFVSANLENDGWKIGPCGWTCHNCCAPTPPPAQPPIRLELSPALCDALQTLINDAEDATEVSDDHRNALLKLLQRARA